MTDARDIAVEAGKTFNLVERLQNRGMPEEDVTIYLDEKLGWDLERLEEKHANTKKQEELADLEAKIKRVRRQLQESAYTFTLRGMTNETYDRIIDEAVEAHPYVYDEQINPLTGQKLKTLQSSDERDNLFNTLFLTEAIARVTDPDGAVDENIDAAAVTFIRKLAPLDAIRRITALAERMRMTGEWMDAIQDEDFSPRP